MVNLITGIDVLILLFYAIVVYLLLKKIVFKNLGFIYYKIFFLFYWVKVFAILLYVFLVVYYWKLADSVNVFSETKNLITLIERNLSNITLLFLPVENYNSIIKLDTTLVTLPGGAGLESNFFLTRVCTLLSPLALGKYLLLNFWFSVFSVVAQFKLYLVLVKIYPEIKKQLTICLLFLPMVVFYGSPIYKETLCFSFLAFAIVAMYHFANKVKRVFNFFVVIVCLLLILLVKSYIFYSLVISVSLVLIFKFLSGLFRSSFIGMVAVILIIFSLSVFIASNSSLLEPYALSIIDMSNLNQQFYNPDGETSSFDFGEIETSLSGLLLKIPVGLYTCYFRPHIWEINKPILLLSALESLTCFLLLCYAIIKKGKNFLSVLRFNILTPTLFFFVIILGIIIGITTFNFGTLVRYKVPSTPFLWIFIFLLLHSKKSKNTLQSEG